MHAERFFPTGVPLAEDSFATQRRSAKKIGIERDETNRPPPPISSCPSTLFVVEDAHRHRERRRIIAWISQTSWNSRMGKNRCGTMGGKAILRKDRKSQEKTGEDPRFLRMSGRFLPSPLVPFLCLLGDQTRRLKTAPLDEFNRVK